MSPKRKVVVTGLGALAPNGNTLSKYWDALISGKSGIRKIKSFDAESLNVKIAGELKDFDPQAYFNRKDIRKLDPFTIYHMVIGRLENFLRVCEVQIQIFWHLKKHENQHDLSIFYIVW